jgi:proline iminopeptidase
MTDGERTINAGGVDHWVRVIGAAHDGVPLVLVHGGPGGNARPIERSVGALLARDTAVVFYDQRGCGRSARPATAGTYTVPRLVADLDVLRAALGVERITPWGVSYGCLIAAEYAVAHPERVDRLVLHAPPIAGRLHPGLWSLRPDAVDAVVGAATRASLRAALVDVEDPIERAWAVSDILGGDADAAARFLYHDRGAAAAARHTSAAKLPPDPEIARALVGAERVGLADDLAALDLPTLIMIGLWDRHVGVDLARSLADRLPRSTLRLFAASAHLPDEEEPDAYVAAIREFLHVRRSPIDSPSA